MVVLYNYGTDILAVFHQEYKRFFGVFRTQQNVYKKHLKNVKTGKTVHKHIVVQLIGVLAYNYACLPNIYQ